MEPADWQRLQEIFDEVADLAPIERASRLDEKCGVDTPLRHEFERMLAGDREPDRFAPAADALLAEDGDALAEGARVGDFRIVRRIASGGMGTVFEAWQEHPPRRVALKLLSVGLGSDEAAQRFRIEAEALARLAHPGVAQVFASGTHGDGLLAVPWLAMEFVESARPITAFARDEALPTEARVELFVAMCDAVQHAHTKGVIHRDLKPGNVLVDAERRPKVIDFGVARVSSEGQVTTVGHLAGTPAYMSPEQWDDPRSVDTRSDVWSLGVLLFELLSGELPVATSDLAARPQRETAPRRLSSVDGRFAGDLEWIAARALERDRERRYATVADLAADLRRHLASEPVVAGPPTAAYRISRFVRRHRVAVLAAAAVALSLVAGIVASLVSLSKARVAAASERRESERARAALQVLEDAFAAPVRRGPKAQIQDLISSAIDLVEKRDELDAESRASLLLVLANSLSRVSDLEGQRKVAARATDLLARYVGPDDPRAWFARMIEASAAAELGDRGAADATLAEAVPRYRRFLAERVPNRVVHYVTVARVAATRGREELVADYLGAVLESGLLERNGYDFAYGRVARARALVDLERFDEARPSIDALWGELGRNDASGRDVDLMTMELRARCLHRDGDVSGALDLRRAARDGWVEHAGPNSLFVASATQAIATSLIALGDHAGAVSESRRALDIARSRLPPDAPVVLDAEATLAIGLSKTGHADEAIALLRDVVASRERGGEAEAIETRRCLADALVGAKLYLEAEAEIRRALEEARRVYRPDDRRLATMQLVLAQSIQLQGRDADADPIFAEVSKRTREIFPNSPWRAARVDIFHARALRDLGR
ncbi:MAG TPA: serine/threonine-protein kinase, partial [Planctomycetota bacterium]|nr:serine/threonine-protein kinase [Planctomycetota bacterium]